MSESDQHLLPDIITYIVTIEADFGHIPEERKKKLQKLTSYLQESKSANKPINLIFICTHNSRRSHMCQLWAQTAAHYYGISEINCFSGGTEATAFNPRSVKVMRKAGFEIEQADASSNPLYLVKYATNIEPVHAFSKKFNDEFNPKNDFAAIMTCSDADAGCPFIPGASFRVTISYEDPKVADNTPEEENRYSERCRQIATEMFYVFSLL